MSMCSLKTKARGESKTLKKLNVIILNNTDWQLVGCRNEERHFDRAQAENGWDSVLRLCRAF